MVVIAAATEPRERKLKWLPPGRGPAAGSKSSLPRGSKSSLREVEGEDCGMAPVSHSLGVAADG